MRQKVAFAAAIVHDPAIVILDEPTNGLDPLERRAMLGRLVSLAVDHGKTILVSTHVLRDVQSICDRLVLLVRGRVRLVGSVAELTGADSRDLRLQGTGPLGDLAARLIRRGVPARPADDSGVFVQAHDTTAVRAIWEEARAAGVVVRSLEPERRPLEEVFLEALAAADTVESRHAPA
jgi:ABC-2 type transport system ATP-binding protein